MVAGVVDPAGEAVTALYGDLWGRGRRLNGLSAGSGSGPCAETGTVRASPWTVIGIPACTVGRAYHGASLWFKYPGEREGERLVPSKKRREAAQLFFLSRTSKLGGRTFGFALQTRARRAVRCGSAGVRFGESGPVPWGMPGARKRMSGDPEADRREGPKGAL